MYQRRSPAPGLLAGLGLFLLVLALTVPGKADFAEWLTEYRQDHPAAVPPAPIGLPNPATGRFEDSGGLGGGGLYAFGSPEARERNCLLFALFYVRDEARKETPLVAVGILRQIIPVGAVPEPAAPASPVSQPPGPADVTPLYVPQNRPADDGGLGAGGLNANPPRAPQPGAPYYLGGR